MGRLIDTNDIRVKPQYMQDVMGIAMIRCEDLSRILADVPTVEAIPKADYEARLKADLEAILVELQLEIEEMSGLVTEIHGEEWNEINVIHSQDVLSFIQQKINELKGE